MRQTLCSSLAVAVVVLVASPALAADPPRTAAGRSTSLGLEAFAGGHFFAEGTNLGVASAPEASTGARSNAILGLRASLGVRPWFTAEVEFLGMVTRDRTYQRNAGILGYRLNALAYLLPGHIRPFVLVGAGAIEVVTTHAQGKAGLVRDRDGEFHVGLGLDYRLLDLLSVRGDARVVEMPGKQLWGLTSDLEATLGVVFTFGAGPRAGARIEAPIVAASPPGAGRDRTKSEAAAGVGLATPIPPPPVPPAPAPTAPAPPQAEMPTVAEMPGSLPVDKPAPPSLSPPPAGIPAAARAPIVKELLGRAKEIRFEGATSKLSPVSLPLVGELAEALVREPGVRIEIVSHTASSGDVKKDLALSRRRAEAVKDALVAKEVATDRLVTTGRGAEDPIAPNITRSGRRRNERTELRLVGADKYSR
jgi:outer membrane protein OmpA-like peptidoglycan-associated protein